MPEAGVQQDGLRNLEPALRVVVNEELIERAYGPVTANGVTFMGQALSEQGLPLLLDPDHRAPFDPLRIARGLGTEAVAFLHDALDGYRWRFLERLHQTGYTPAELAENQHLIPLVDPFMDRYQEASISLWLARYFKRTTEGDEARRTAETSLSNCMPSLFRAFAQTVHRSGGIKEKSAGSRMNRVKNMLQALLWASTGNTARADAAMKLIGRNNIQTAQERFSVVQDTMGTDEDISDESLDQGGLARFQMFYVELKQIFQQSSEYLSQATLLDWIGNIDPAWRNFLELPNVQRLLTEEATAQVRSHIAGYEKDLEIARLSDPDAFFLEERLSTKRTSHADFILFHRRDFGHDIAILNAEKPLRRHGYAALAPIREKLDGLQREQLPPAVLLEKSETPSKPAAALNGLLQTLHCGDWTLLEYGSGLTDPTRTQDFWLVVQDPGAFFRALRAQNSPHILQNWNRLPIQEAVGQVRLYPLYVNGVWEGVPFKICVTSTELQNRACKLDVLSKNHPIEDYPWNHFTHVFRVSGQKTTETAGAAATGSADPSEKKGNHLPPALEEAFTYARAYALWLSLAALEDTFTLQDLILTTASLGYRADDRPEAQDKVATILNNLGPTFEDIYRGQCELFVELGILQKAAPDEYNVVSRPTEQEVDNLLNILRRGSQRGHIQYMGLTIRTNPLGAAQVLAHKVLRSIGITA